jgi:hypothetical protein
MILQLKGLLENFVLIHHVLAFVKDEGKILGSMTTSLQFTVDCKPLKISWVYEGTCFGHVMSKACHSAINDDKASVGLTLVNVKVSQVRLHETITWTKKLKNERQEWERACMDMGLWP